MGKPRLELTQLGHKGTYDGIQMSFDNGNTISIQWHINCYTSNREPSMRMANGFELAEVAIRDEENRYATMQFGDQVEGFVDTNRIAELIHLASTKTIEEISELNKIEGGIR